LVLRARRQLRQQLGKAQAKLSHARHGGDAKAAHKKWRIFNFHASARVIS
jgi:hypothetical protein